ncbi:transmembrane 9 superfamily member 2, partial [Halocaridina rubra]
IEFLKPESCREVCIKEYDPKNVDQSNFLKELKRAMNLNYYHHWIVDNMPLTWCYIVEGGSIFCATGFPVGCYVDSAGRPKDACVMDKRYKTPETYYIFNHVDLNITYHSGETEDWGSALHGSGGRIL